MMAGNSTTSPTKSNLRRIREDLEFAYEGYDLLNQKREILVIEILQYIKNIREVEEAFHHTIEALYSAYKKCAMSMGSEIVSLKSKSERRSYFITVEYSRFMGLQFPSIKISLKKIIKTSGFWGTTGEYDEIKQKSLQVLENLASYSTIFKSIFILSRELKKVQRRVNALEKIFIPENENARKYITDRLEEIERDELYIKRLIQQKS